MRDKLAGSANEESDVINTSNDDIIKAMDEESDLADKWDLSKVYVYTDPDGVRVPVPIVFTTSGATLECTVNN